MAVRRRHIRKRRTKRVNPGARPSPESGCRQTPVVRGNPLATECDFCDTRTPVHQERGRQTPVVLGLHLQGYEVRAVRSGKPKPAPVVLDNTLARALAPTSARLPTVQPRTPLQLRYHAHGGLTPAAVVSRGLGPACGLRFPLLVRF